MLRAFSSLARRVAVQGVGPRAMGTTAFRAAATAQAASMDAGWEAHVFPRERPGLDYNLNWALCAQDVVPAHSDAFHNHDVEGLVEIGGKDGVLKAGGAKPSVFVVGDNSGEVPWEGWAKAASFVDTGAYQAAYRSVTDALSSSGAPVFVRDGALGSSRAGEVRVRVMTNDAAVDGFLAHMMERVPVPAHPRDFAYHASVYVAPSVTHNGAPFVMLDGAAKRVVIGGTASTEAVRDALVQVASGVWAGQGNLLLAGTAVKHGDGVAVVLGADSGADADVYAAHHAVWTEGGLARVWRGVTAKGAAASEGAVVDGDLVTTPMAAHGPNLVEHPTAVVLVSKGVKKAGTLSPQEARAMFMSAGATCFSDVPLSAPPALLGELFEARVEAANVPCFVVPSAGDVAKVLGAKKAPAAARVPKKVLSAAGAFTTPEEGAVAAEQPATIIERLRAGKPATPDVEEEPRPE